MARLKVRVTPAARRDAVIGWMGHSAGSRQAVLKLRVKAPPERGKANDAVIALLAGALGIPESHISVVRGANSRDKILEIDGLREDELRARLHAAES